MSYHILHITQPNSYLSTDRGFLTCETKGEDTKSIAIDDIRALIVETQGVAFSNNSLAKLMEKDCAILHCNNSFQPVGWTMPLDRIIRKEAFEKQLSAPKDFNNHLWKVISRQKVLNQAQTLDLLEVEHDLYRLINKPLMSEANIAKIYWNHYFFFLSEPMNREHFNAVTFENSALNYGYAIINTLIYRSILIHGLLPNLGMHHKGKYRSVPLVYDAMEPFRAFIDLILFKFSRENTYEFEEEDFKSWIKYLSENLRICRLKYKEQSYKLMDFVDVYIESLANCYEKMNVENLYLPQITDSYFHIDNHKNREYEE